MGNAAGQCPQGFEPLRLVHARLHATPGFLGLDATRDVGGDAVPDQAAVGESPRCRVKVDVLRDAVGTTQANRHVQGGQLTVGALLLGPEQCPVFRDNALEQMGGVLHGHVGRDAEDAVRRIADKDEAPVLDPMAGHLVHHRQGQVLAQGLDPCRVVSQLGLGSAHRLIRCPDAGDEGGAVQQQVGDPLGGVPEHIRGVGARRGVGERQAAHGHHQARHRQQTLLIPVADTGAAHEQCRDDQVDGTQPEFDVCLQWRDADAFDEGARQGLDVDVAHHDQHRSDRGPDAGGRGAADPWRGPQCNQQQRGRLKQPPRQPEEGRDLVAAVAEKRGHALGRQRVQQIAHNHHQEAAKQHVSGLPAVTIEGVPGHHHHQ